MSPETLIDGGAALVCVGILGRLTLHTLPKQHREDADRITTILADCNEREIQQRQLFSESIDKICKSMKVISLFFFTASISNAGPPPTSLNVGGLDVKAIGYEQSFTIVSVDSQNAPETLCLRFAGQCWPAYRISRTQSGSRYRTLAPMLVPTVPKPEPPPSVTHTTVIQKLNFDHSRIDKILRLLQTKPLPPQPKKVVLRLKASTQEK